MSMKSKTVLVTGAGGFIGSHLTERLVNMGANVKAFVRYNSRNDWGLLELLPREILNRLEVIQGDLKDSEAVKQAAMEVHTIFHLGALIAIPYSYVHPRETIETNILGTLNILNAAAENNVKKIVHTSTSEVYGTAKYVPIDEKHPLQGQSPYSASKIGADKIAESFYLSYGSPVAIIRPFNTYGPRQSARAIIPTIIAQALTGTKIKLGATTPKRDLTYVDDTVNGFIKVADSKKAIGEVINISSNTEISIGDLAKKIINLIDKDKLQLKTDKKRIRPKASEVLRLKGDNRKAKRLLGWKPQVTIDEGLATTIKWISKNLELYKPSQYNL
jgi:NAD dependent epimerase/dehydratase